MIQQDHLQVFDLTLKTQSPLFVGSGRKIGKREYIYSPNQGCVKILNMELFFDYMLRHDLVRQFEKFMLSPTAVCWTSGPETVILQKIGWNTRS